MADIFAYDFIIRGLIAGAMVGIIAPIIGIFLVVRRLSLMADALAHISFFGVAMGLLLRIDPFLSSIFFATVSSVAIEKLRNSTKGFPESIMAIFIFGSLSLGIIAVSLAKGFSSSIFSFLFGSISTVTSNDLIIMALIFAIVLFFICIMYKKLFLISFSDDLARVRGIKVEQINYLFMILSALAVTISAKIVGVLLVGALMVIPVVASINLKHGFFKTILFAISFSLFSLFAGILLSFYFDLPTGAVIVLVSAFIFGLTLLFKRG